MPAQHEWVTTEVRDGMTLSFRPAFDVLKLLHAYSEGLDVG